jgi:hypothetical protein
MKVSTHSYNRFGGKQVAEIFLFVPLVSLCG